MITSRRFYRIGALPLSLDERCYDFNTPYRSAYPSQLSEIRMDELTGEGSLYPISVVNVFYNRARGVISYITTVSHLPKYKWDKQIYVRNMDDDSVLALIRSTLLNTRRKGRCWG